MCRCDDVKFESSVSPVLQWEYLNARSEIEMERQLESINMHFDERVYVDLVA